VNIAFILAGIGLGLMVGLSGTGSAIGLVIGGTSAIGAVKKKA
jgi:V/A-type H+-transporting ATPase subunit K